MSQNQTTIRLYEALITILGSYLAISSFFNSSLYKTIASGLSMLLRLFHIQTLSSQQITTIIPLLVTLFVSLLIVYDYIMGKPDNIINIYQLNLLLITPEILSYNKLDWLNLIQKPQILEPTRGSAIIYFSGAVILLGYLSLYFISISRKTSHELTTRGVEPTRINEIFIRQSTLSINLTAAATLVSSVVFLSIEPLDILIQTIFGQQPYNYLAYGVPGAALLLFSLWFYLREQGKIEEN